ncbi:granzyme B(G,H) [Chelmon rostratus]|uniref:granzyme B(G,H) n=1 Tax=Chelmon rostratus TaxID=109905 RepID=UPI001BE68F35|nr:granzyme B(G,H) [Chelmon rostratus]
MQQRSVAELCCDLTMHIHWKLITLILALTLDGRVHAGQIFGGHEAVAHSRPYMVVLDLHKQDGRKTNCAGFLLNEDFVMTAAHCQAQSYTVKLGVHNIHNNNEIQCVSVQQTFPHKDYNETGYRNDIMLLKLSSKANFSNHVKPIALAGQADDSLPKSCIVSGWGITDKNSKFMSDVLMEVNVTLIDNKQCAKDNLYCSEGETGPRKGDSGGPLVCEDGKAYGVVSSCFKPNSGGPLIYSFAKISDYRSWIDLIVKNA